MIIAIHGGAGSISHDERGLEEADRALRAALEMGRAVLLGGGRALDAVVEAVVVMEGSGAFNAGKGAVRASDGAVTLDAAVMNGATRGAGAVAAVTGLAHPVLAARLVLECTPHVLLAGAGAEAFAHAEGLLRAPADYFHPAAELRMPGTVGAVALDMHGALAAATSTGGLAGKLPGRVGDSPLIGAGTYADGGCAVSATGTGEVFIRALFAARIALAVESGVAIAEAARVALAEVAALGGVGGCIAVDVSGAVALPFNSAGMFRGVAGQDRLETAVFPAG